MQNKVRDKLIELLLGKSIDTVEDVEYVVDYLIANGVTVQEWISVKNELPKDNGKLQAFLVCRNQPSATSGKVLIKTEFFTNAFNGNNNITHWMPLPQPPKGD